MHVSTAGESEMCYVRNMKCCAIFIVYIADFRNYLLEIFLLTIVRKVELVVKGRALPWHI